MLRLGTFFRTTTGPVTAPKVYTTTVTTGTNGAWSVTFPSGFFTAAPIVSAQAISTGTTAATQYQANPTAPTTTTLAGTATAGVNAIVVGGATTSAAPSGTVIHVKAIGS